MLFVAEDGAYKEEANEGAVMHVVGVSGVGGQDGVYAAVAVAVNVVE